MPNSLSGFHGASTTLYCPGVAGGLSENEPLAGHSPPLTALSYFGYVSPQTIVDVSDLSGPVSVSA